MHMKIKTSFIFILLSVLLFQGCNSNSTNKVSIQGNFSNIPGTRLYIYQILPDSKPLIDSVSTDASGNFLITLPIKNAGLYSLARNAANEITLIISPGEKIIVNGDGNAMRNTYTVEGSKESKLYYQYNKFTSANLIHVDSLSRVFAENSTNPDFKAVKQQLDSAYIGIFNNQKKEVIAFVNSHLNSLASLLVVSDNFGPNPVLTQQTYPELFLKLDSALFRTYPENSLVNTFHRRMLDFKAEIADAIASDKLLQPGMPSPEITLPNSAGKEIKLSSLHGKLTLVYFWSSWNALSRQTNMNLTPLYIKYHDRGFEIYAVSIDSDAELWKKSYMLDKAYWIQVNDTKGLESDYCKTYAVKEIPKMFLVGRDGKIIARDPEFSELEALIKKNL